MAYILYSTFESDIIKQADSMQIHFFLSVAVRLINQEYELEISDYLN